MSNPFIEKEQAVIPRELDDCCLTDSIARELWRIAQVVEAWGVIILIGIILLGIICSFISAGVVAEFIGFFDKNSEDSSFTAFLISAVPWLIGAVLEYVIYHLIALAIRARAAVVQNTRVAANVALYTAYINQNTIASYAQQNPVAQSTHNTSARPRFIPHPDPAPKSDKPGVEPIYVSPEEIQCPVCKKNQRADRKTCWFCNQPFQINS